MPLSRIFVSSQENKKEDPEPYSISSSINKNTDIVDFRNEKDFEKSGLEYQSIIRNFHKPTPLFGLSPSTSIYSDRVSWLGVVSKTATDSISVSGFKHTVNPINRARRWLWILLISIAFLMTSLGIIEQCFAYSSFPKTVTIELENPSALPFPSVAICNFNRYKQTDILGTSFNLALRDYLLGTNYSYIYASELQNVTMTEILRNASHTAWDTFVSSNLGQETLWEHNYTQKITDFGPCHVFNMGENAQDGLMINDAGTREGYSAILYVDQDDYHYEEHARLAAGFKIYLFDKGSEPQVNDLGFALFPGTETYVGMDYSEVEYLPPPHGDCSNKILKYYDTYGKAECEMECATDFVIRRCGCKLPFMPGYHRECNPMEYFKCGFDEYEHNAKNFKCRCPKPCRTATYQPSISYALWPAGRMSARLAEAYGIDPIHFRQNYCVLNIYFREIAIKRVKEQPEYTIYNLMSDIGGTLGFWLGGSILTFFELFDLFGHSICVYSRVKRRPSADLKV